VHLISRPAKGFRTHLPLTPERTRSLLQRVWSIQAALMTMWKYKVDIYLHRSTSILVNTFYLYGIYNVNKQRILSENN
jgi:hypothetical protein